MTIHHDLNFPEFYSPAHTQIIVKGTLDKTLSEYLGGLKIVWRTNKDKIKTSQLEGEIADQASLIGVVNALYNMRFPIISVKLKVQKSNIKPDKTSALHQLPTQLVVRKKEK